ncbi:unnamed protein product [Effrenium voratum]|uniref:Uncharacterized protein n=1 Tax=Effrenium voratum TaxID=2562239 RepID=A0AA36IEI4_9DINO|nr:unnamed protein product [Effrenium voratum]CAJ1427306.1 unnamed protein product [Effrenium voratum]
MSPASPAHGALTHGSLESLGSLTHESLEHELRDILGLHGLINWHRITQIWFAHAWGHWQLGVRGCCATCNMLLSFQLCTYGIDVEHRLWLAICQGLAAVSLFMQWWLASPYMFLIRASACVAKSLILLHLTICGRNSMFNPVDCDMVKWDDPRVPFRIMHGIMVVYWMATASSLTMQFLQPLRGVSSTTGNIQLWIRARIRATGVPVQLARGILKPILLTGTEYERAPIEAVINITRAGLICIVVWSLDNQWRTSGVVHAYSPDATPHDEDQDLSTCTSDESIKSVLDEIPELLQ